MVLAFVTAWILWMVCEASLGGDFTFFVVSDTHYGTDPLADAIVSRLVDQMNTLPGTPWPPSLGGQVDLPLGVVHLGDITNDGTSNSLRKFLADYGQTGQDGRLRFPVFEVWGNHDGGPRQSVQQVLVERNRRRGGRAGVHVSTNGLFCSWNWGGIHFVALGICPGTSRETYDPQDSLAFLVEDLARHMGSSGRPVVLCHHFGFDRHSLGWWPQEFRTAYREAIRPYNIVAIFHGHSHETLAYDWEGIAVFSPPHLRRSRPGAESPFTHGFFAVRVQGCEMSIAERRVDGTWGQTFRAMVRWPSPEKLPDAAPAVPTRDDGRPAAWPALGCSRSAVMLAQTTPGPVIGRVGGAEIYLEEAIGRRSWRKVIPSMH